MAPLSPRSNGRRTRRKVLLFCKHPVAQQKFLRLLGRSDFDVAVAPEFQLPESDAKDSATISAEVAVIDGSDPEATLKFVRLLHFERHSLHMLVLLPKLEDCLTHPLLRLGVKGVLAYEQIRELARAVSHLATGAYWVPRDLLSRFVESILPELQGAKSLETDVEISRREREVLDLLLENLSNKEIASKLFVAERTVKFHVSNLLSKFHVQRRADLIVLWMQRPRAHAWEAREPELPLSIHIN